MEIASQQPPQRNRKRVGGGGLAAARSADSPLMLYERTQTPAEDTLHYLIKYVRIIIIVYSMWSLQRKVASAFEEGPKEVL